MKRPAKPRSWPSRLAGGSATAAPPRADPETATDEFGDAPSFAADSGPLGESGTGLGADDGPVMDAGFGEDDPDYDYVPAASPLRGKIPPARPPLGARPGPAASTAGPRGRSPGLTEDPDESGYGTAFQRGYPGDYQTGSFGGVPADSFTGPRVGGPMYEGTDTTQRPVPDRPTGLRSRLTGGVRPFRRSRAVKDSRPGRQAQLTVSRVEPWSVMKFSFVISLVAFIVLFVAVAVLYGVLNALGVFSALERTVSSITSSQSSTGFALSHYLSASRVLGYAGLLGAVNVVLITALSTVGAVLYNITADLAGGVEVTLKESD